MKVILPVLGCVSVLESKNEPGHYFWSSVFGWHHCNRNEDLLILESLS